MRPHSTSIGLGHTITLATCTILCWNANEIGLISAIFRPEVNYDNKKRGLDEPGGWITIMDINVINYRDWLRWNNDLIVVEYN